MKQIRKLWVEEGGQDIAEYAVMLAVILVLVVGTFDSLGPTPTLCSPMRRVRFNRAELGLSGV